MDTSEGYIGVSCICILQGEGTNPPIIFFDMPLVAVTYNSSDAVAFRLSSAWVAILLAFRQSGAQPLQPSNCSVPDAQLGT